MKTLCYVLPFAVLALFGFSGLYAQALEPVGGPYTVDTNTVVLFHFDGNVDNAAAAVGKTAGTLDKHTTNPAKIYFLPNSGISGMGQCVRLDNSAMTDSTYLTLRDTAALDLTGDWTMECWVNIFTFGATASDYRWVPRTIMKPGEDVFWHPNYWNEMWGDNRLYHVGYYTPNDEFISCTSENNMFTPGAWVHMTFIRDTKRGIIAEMIHDANKKLISFVSTGFTPSQVPRPNANPLHIGWAGALVNALPSTDSWLDGFIDELRISKVVRNFAGPPVVTNVTQLPNQSSGVASYQVKAKVQPFNPGGTVTISKVTLYYYVTKWDSVAMTGSGVDYSATLPGQSVGTQVKYYVAAVDNQGNRATVPLMAEKTPPAYYSFWVFQPNVQTLWVTFEEGPGKNPVDHSTPAKTIFTFRVPDYSTDAKQGQYSLLLKNDPTKIDFNWVEAESPYAFAGEEWCLDFWMKADSALHATRVINYPRQPDDWNNNNYEVSLRNNAKGVVAITGRYMAPATGALVLTQDTSGIVLGKWYHVIYERTKSNNTVGLMVRDENDLLLYRQTKVDSTPVMGGSVVPCRLRIGRCHFDSTNYWYVAPFRGRIDNVQLYNYAKLGFTAGVGDGDQGLPWEFDLAQNYPNPFNPTTRIQFTVPKFQYVDLIVYDILGRKVKTLASEPLHAGPHWRSWDGTNDVGLGVASGVYFYRLVAGDMTKTQKMVLMR